MGPRKVVEREWKCSNLPLTFTEHGHVVSDQMDGRGMERRSSRQHSSRALVVQRGQRIEQSLVLSADDVIGHRPYRIRDLAEFMTTDR